MSNGALLMGAQGVGVMLPLDIRATDIKGHWSSALSPPPLPNPSLYPFCSQSPSTPEHTFLRYYLRLFVILAYLLPQRQRTGCFPRFPRYSVKGPPPSVDAQVMLLDEGINEC